MLDNYGLTEAMSGVHNIKNVIYREALADFLTMFVFWDELYYPHTSMSNIWLGTLSDRSILDYVKPIYIDDGLYDKRVLSNLVQNVPGQYKSAVEYLYFSNMYGLNYSPAKAYSEFLYKFLHYDELNNNVKKYILEQISNEIAEEYLLIENKFKKNNRILLFPSIGDYIVNYCEETGDYIDTALQIKNERETRIFRHYLEKIEDQVNLGNESELKRCLKNAEEIARNIAEGNEKVKLSSSLNLSIFPLGLSVNIAPEFTDRKRVQFSFIQNLSEYYLR